MKNVMKGLSLCCGMLCFAGTVLARELDPVVMRINGKDVTRSEFEYNINKDRQKSII